jgi:hypothetical protein
VFYINVAKIYQDVAMVFQVYVPNVLLYFQMYVARVDIDVAYTCMLQAYVSSVSYVCCKCFIWMLHMFCNGYTVFS